MTTVHDLAHYVEQTQPQLSASLPIRIASAVLDDMRQHAEVFYPHECCGILLGRLTENSIVVEEGMRAGNTRRDSAHNRYNIEAADLLRAQREGRARSLEIVGFYHSHPDHPAFWSPTDLQEAHWFGCAYVITSVDGSTGAPRAHQTSSFLLAGSSEEDKSFQTQALQVV